MADPKFPTDAHRDTYGDLKRAAQTAEDNIAGDLNRLSLKGVTDVNALGDVAHSPTVEEEVKKQRAIQELRGVRGITLHPKSPSP